VQGTAWRWVGWDHRLVTVSLVVLLAAPTSALRRLVCGLPQRKSKSKKSEVMLYYSAL